MTYIRGFTVSKEACVIPQTVRDDSSYLCLAENTWQNVCNRFIEKLKIYGKVLHNMSLCCLNSLAPGRFQITCNFRLVIFKLTLVNGGWGISYEIALRWMPLDLTDDKSTLVQVMAWCCQETSHYLSQCWSRSMSPNGVTRPQWVDFTLIGHKHSLCKY